MVTEASALTSADTLCLWVPSAAVSGSKLSQGSKSLATGRNGRTVLLEAHRETLKPWRQRVRQEAWLAWLPREPLTGPVRLEITFLITPYASTPVRTRTLPWRQGTGDFDKLARAIADALGTMGTGKKKQPGIIYNNDAQIVSAEVSKDWAGVDEAGQQIPPGALIRVSPYVPERYPRDLVGDAIRLGCAGLVS